MTKSNILSNRQNRHVKFILIISRITGALLLLSFLIPVFNWLFILSNFIPEEKTIITTQNILANESLFRLSVFNQILTAIIIFALGFVLYIVLKSVNRKLAIFALYFKFFEAILTVIIALCHFIMLLVLKEQQIALSTDIGQIQLIVGLFIKEYITITAFPGIFSGISLMIFSYLLFKSKYIPSKLAVFGIISSILVIIFDSLTILFPEFVKILIVQIICTTPIGLFIVITGLWLIFKGIQINN